MRKNPYTALLVTVTAIGGLTGASEVLAVSANTLPLTYEYSVPYSGSATITIRNNSSTAISLSKINFTANASLSGSPWGTLFGWQSTMTSSANPDGINYDYAIVENPTVTIPANASAALTYTIASYGGSFKPNNVAMDPSKVAVTVAGTSTSTPIGISGACSGTQCNDPGKVQDKNYRITGYFPDWAHWRSPKFEADSVPYDKVNTVIYAFSIFDKDGKVSLYDQESDAVNLPIISQARKKYPYLNASLSFGGWGWFSTPGGWQCTTGDSPNGPAACFQQMAANPAAVDKFVAGAVAGMKEVQFNGIDIDWEYPETADAANYVNLLQKLRVALDNQSRIDGVPYYLTVATGAGIDKINHLTPKQWQAVGNAVSYIGVMTYDFHGAWDQKSDFMSAMKLDPLKDPSVQDSALGKYDVTDAMNAYLGNGILPAQLLVGIPMYGRMDNITTAGNTQGLYQNITGPAKGEFDDTGLVNYHCIVDASTCGNGYKLPALTLVDPTTTVLGAYALTPWGYANNLFVTYDDAKSAAYKTSWAKAFGGVMLWDFTGDFPDNDSRSIVNAIYQEFKKS